MNKIATRSGNPPLPPSSNPPLSPRQTLPTMYDLPSEDPEEIRMPDEYHGLQSFLLRCTFLPGNFTLEQVFVGTDLNIYYARRNLNWYKRPDWFAASRTTRETQTADGELIITPNEEAAAAQQRAERLAAKLRELNIDPDSL